MSDHLDEIRRKVGADKESPKVVVGPYDPNVTAEDLVNKTPAQLRQEANERERLRLEAAGYDYDGTEAWRKLMVGIGRRKR